MNMRPHDQHCETCDMAEFAGITYDAAHTPPPAQERRSVCPDCGGGWTFDFMARRVYCRHCQGEVQA